ncbi:MAG: hypothetical protein RSH78_05740, partial [Bacilli bacterium]
YKKDNSNIKEQLDQMLKEVKKEKITCLRISDYNTTGLIGVSDNEKAFYALTKESGVSYKGGTSGGSKGIGKYASFVASLFNTVFYSTYTQENEMGYIGICKLCSAPVKESDEKTQGIGYYSSDRKNSPIPEKLKLDPNFDRTSYGTDVYILGFKNEKNWKKEIVTKILDSFMSAIYFDELEVTVDNIILNKNTIEGIIDSSEYIIKNYEASIKSQYILLNNPSVHKTTVNIEDYGSVDIYLKSFSKEELNLATNDCVMIRYPYMKIKTIKSISSVPCSAMCIIPNNFLNKILRDVENPQHTDWEFKRINEDKREEIQSIYNTLKTKIYEFAQETLSSSENNEIDVEGASNYLPSIDKEGFGNHENIAIDGKPKITNTIKNKIKEKIGINEDLESNALQPDVGSIVERGDGSPVPEGKNKGSGSDPHDSGNKKGNSDNGKNDILKFAQLSGMKYRYFVVDKKCGKYVITFISLYNEKNCDFEINYLDDSGSKYDIGIKKCFINGQQHQLENGKIKNLELIEGTKYKIEIETELKGLYACEVKIYANR